MRPDSQDLLDAFAPALVALARQAQDHLGIDRHVEIVETALQGRIGAELDIAALDIGQNRFRIALPRQSDAFLHVVFVQLRRQHKDLVVGILAPAGAEFFRVIVLLLALDQHVDDFAVTLVHAEIGIGIEQIADAFARHPFDLGANAIQRMIAIATRGAAATPVAERTQERAAAVGLDDRLKFGFGMRGEHIVEHARRVRRGIVNRDRARNPISRDC